MSQAVASRARYPLPTTFSINSKKEAAHSVEKISDEELERIHATCKALGFGEGAIVALRPLNRAEKWKRTSHLQWGVVSYLNHFRAPHEAFAPLVVHWFSPLSHNGEQVDHLWPQELYLIHAAMTKDLLETMLNRQDEAV